MGRPAGRVSDQQPPRPPSILGNRAEQAGRGSEKGARNLGQVDGTSVPDALQRKEAWVREIRNSAAHIHKETQEGGGEKICPVQIYPGPTAPAATTLR